VWTIGVGRNLQTKGITQEEAMILLNNDIEEAIRDLEETIFPEMYYVLPYQVRLVLVNMRFQMGPKGFRGFREMIRELKKDPIDYQKVVKEMKDSLWFKVQTPERAKELVRIMKEFAAT
jgi:lysozyme